MPILSRAIIFYILRILSERLLTVSGARKLLANSFGVFK
jgi:hypothetical protein